MNTPNYPPEFSQLPSNVRTTAVLFSTLAQTVIKYFNTEDFKLSPLNFIILTNTMMVPGISMSALAEKTGISKPQLSRNVSNLEELQLLERKHNTDNRRIVNVHPAEKGKELMNSQFLSVAGKLDNTLSTLSIEDRDHLNSLMNETLDILSKAGIVPDTDHMK